MSQVTNIPLEYRIMSHTAYTAPYSIKIEYAEGKTVSGTFIPLKEYTENVSTEDTFALMNSIVTPDTTIHENVKIKLYGYLEAKGLTSGTLV